MPGQSKFDKLDDQDILRLANIKEMVFPVYNYEKLAVETKKHEEAANAFEKDPRSKEAALLSVKNEI